MEQALEHLHNILAHDERYLEQARVRLYPYFEPPARREEFGALFNPTSYSIDFGEKNMALLWKGEPRYQANFEVSGHYDRSTETWRWPGEESSLRKFCTITPPLSLLAQSELKIDEITAKSLAGWISLKAGYFSAYEIAVSEDAVTFIAVKTVTPKLAFTFCPVCFRNEHDGEKMVRFSEGLALCAPCIALTLEIFESQAEEKQLTLENFFAGEDRSPKVESGLPFSPCLLCGERKHVLLASHVGICGPCALQAKKVLPSKS